MRELAPAETAALLCQSCRESQAAFELDIDWMPFGKAAICAKCSADIAVATDRIGEWQRARYDRAAREQIVVRAERRYPYALEDATETAKSFKIFNRADESAFILFADAPALWRIKLLDAPAEEPKTRRRKRRRRPPKIDRTAAASAPEQD